MEVIRSKPEFLMRDIMDGDSRREIKISEHGFVALVDVMPRFVPGDRTADFAVIQAARVSVGQGLKTEAEDRNLIRYMMSGGYECKCPHSSPFEMCLGGDTRIPTMPSKGAAQRFYTIKELADAFASGGKRNSWVKLVHIRTVDENGIISATKISNVWKTGRMMTYRVTEDSGLGRTITSTATHPFLTPTGYKLLSQLRVGDEILQNGNAILDGTDLQEMWDDGFTLEEIAQSLGTSRSSAVRMLQRNGVDTRRRCGWRRKQNRTIAAGRSQARKMTPPGNCQVCGSACALDVHHRDKNPDNNETRNRLRVCRSCHKALDRQSVQMKVYTRQISSIEPCGMADVYDLEVASGNHNFVAEGFVVHNCEFKFHMGMPIFVARQLIRHRTANVNEYSARYSVMQDKFYIPDQEGVRGQGKTNKQVAEGELSYGDADAFINNVEMTAENCYRDYERALKAGVGRELARMLLPLNTYTFWYWKIDLHNLFHFLNLRMDSHAQKEIRDYANAMWELIQPIAPWSCEAFRDYKLESVTLSRLEVNALANRNASNPQERELQSDNKREQQAWEAKKLKLGLKHYPA